ncbi:MarR family winged helix-turn-helix transcriptional regulator [Streptomyces sp. NPDC051569]|uniref:MarR family winged helix-turn-helix transcriptional regulator n=1 Tax=Streptomyces sp. NPDC051569 TaxID=3365661 RepID=UPI0037A302AC
MSDRPSTPQDTCAAWTAFISGVRLMTRELDKGLRRDLGMGYNSYVVLAALAEAPGHRLTMTSLAHRTQSPGERLSHAVVSLRTNGLVTVENDSTDRRLRYAVITPAGLATVERAAPAHTLRVQRLLLGELDATGIESLRQLGQIMRASSSREACAPEAAAEAARRP